jgi:hypothetical protein
MNGVVVMRGLACAMAVAAAIDPSVRLATPAPLSIAVRASSGALVSTDGTSGIPAEARDLRARIEAAMPGSLAINAMADPQALIVAGPRLDASAIPARGPVSFLLPVMADGASLQVLSVSNPRPVLPGWAAVVAAEVVGHALVPGSSSVIVLESHGVEVDRVEHRWTGSDERFTARLAFAPPTAGSFGLTVRALPLPGHVETKADMVPVRVVAEPRRLKILALDPRPSWGSGFARRALEEDPDFEVAGRVRASRGLEVRTGGAPAALSAEALNPFDLVLVGAPEGLTTSEVAALESFARRRGGAVVLMADRKPSGSYLRLLGTDTFDEALVEKPVRITADDGTSIRASEFAYPRTLPVGADPIVRLPQDSGSRAPIVSAPLGAGRIIFSGLLDAWRFRAEDDEAFASFWRSLLGREAARAPRRLEVSLDPGVATAGSRVRLRAAVRATDQIVAGNVVRVPAVTARAIDERGHQQFVRMWPAGETGVYEGWFDVPRAGRYDVRVETDAGTSADTPFVVTAGESREDAVESARLPRVIASATGGVVMTTAEVGLLVDQLRGLPRKQIVVARHPMRSPWWVVAFIGLLSVEWTARRRRGLR